MSGVLLSALLVQQPVRIVVGRLRPFAGRGHAAFEPLTLDDSHASFVSGHTWSAFGLSTVVAHEVDRWWASVGLYSLATITGLSRLYADKHWLTDVLLGGLAGYAIGTALWEEHRDGDGDGMGGAGSAFSGPPFVVLRFAI